MPKIQVLPQAVAELIAAGEVVERPASVIKELTENAIDAGATHITVEIQRGGISYIRIRDDGCGIAASEVPTAFLRHATSKITREDDLNAIGTLGFRGEALAAIASVSRVELFTKTRKETAGTHYKIEGGAEVLREEAGCPDGTTIIIRDLFYNTPARMKFLKKDVSEANAAGAVVDRIALSHPEISFQMIRDGKQTLTTAGGGKTDAAVYSVLGREFAKTLIPVGAERDRIGVTGLTCKPVSCRPTRNNQFVFLNGRLVRSGTVTAAVEQAYKNSAMIGKFPGFVLYLTVPPESVDVNVHPAKTEVRFSDERKIFDAVYYAIRDALKGGDTRPEISLRGTAFNPFERLKTDTFKQEKLRTETVAEAVYDHPVRQRDERSYLRFQSSAPAVREDHVFTEKSFEKPPQEEKQPPEIKPAERNLPETEPAEKKPVSTDIIRESEERPEVILIGEAFSTYIVAQMGNSVYLIDKHAAHERILFNRLKETQKAEAQALLNPVSVPLRPEEYDAILSHLPELEAAGFEAEDFGQSSVLVRTVPATLMGENIAALIEEVADCLMRTGRTEPEALGDLFHTVACKAAIKAGSLTSRQEMEALAKKVLYSDELRYCPHGRPIAFEIKKRELEKQFGRIQ